MEYLSRRQFLASTAAAGMPGSIPSPPVSGRPDLAMAAAVRAARRAEIAFNDQTTMAHPMHLLGRHVQVGAINGKRFAGSTRDTVLAPSRGNVAIAFEASSASKWALSPRSPRPQTKSLWSSLLASDPTKSLIDTLNG